MNDPNIFPCYFCQTILTTLSFSTPIDFFQYWRCRYCESLDPNIEYVEMSEDIELKQSYVNIRYINNSHIHLMLLANKMKLYSNINGDFTIINHIPSDLEINNAANKLKLYLTFS